MEPDKSKYLMHKGSGAYLAHGHKYVKKEYKNGRWVYYYPGDIPSNASETVRGAARSLNSPSRSMAKDASRISSEMKGTVKK